MNIAYRNVLLLDIKTLVLVGLLKNSVDGVADILPHFLSLVNLPDHSRST